MSTPTLEADLRFAVSLDGARSIEGRLTGTGSRLTLEVDSPSAFAGRSDAPAIAALADALARAQVVVRVESKGQHLITLGAVRGRWWYRRLTGTRHIRLGRARGLWAAAKGRARGGGGLLPDTSVAPPTTPWPPAPTFQRRVRRRPTATVDPAGGGEPRLVLFREQVWEGEKLPVFWLHDGDLVGSGEDCAIRLRGLAPHHARLARTDDDEWVVESLDGPVRVHGLLRDRQLLRTGARVQVGEHVLVYRREEFADHGRPYGGRVGGELGRQAPQGPVDPPGPQA